MNTSEKIDELAKALIAVQKELKPAPKKSENPFFKSTYADLTTIIETASPILTRNGLAISQVCEGAGVTTVLLHSSGQYLSGTLTLNPSKNDPQGIGSALTYARRYGYASIIGLATEDDDGNEASKPAETKPAKPAQKRADVKTINDELEKIATLAELQSWWVKIQPALKGLSETDRNVVAQNKDIKKEKLQEAK